MKPPRADLYQALAEVLAEPPHWLALAGREWPLTAAALRLARSSEAARRAVVDLVEIPAEALVRRQTRYKALFAASDRPPLWLYESAYRQGRLLGETSFALARLYQAAGLEIAGAELPDHAAVELAFLAHLANRAADEPEHKTEWRRLERRFIKKHAGCWLPALGKALVRSGDAVYAPIGRLLAEWLEEAGRSNKVASILVRRPRLPGIAHQDDCTLCGFCIQACPTRALTIRETAHETSLLLSAAHCVSCAKCEQVCSTGALRLSAAETGMMDVNAFPGQANWRPLRRSPRAICPGCGEATVSCAELDFVATNIGRPDWLVYCLTCRPYLMETV